MGKPLHCVSCYIRRATRVVVIDHGGSRWSRALCDDCVRVPHGATLVSDKEITFKVP